MGNTGMSKRLASFAIVMAALLFTTVRTGAAAASLPNVAATAWHIVSTIHGTWQRAPGLMPSSAMPGGAMLGNGDLGVVVGGRQDQLTFYIGKSNFFGVERGHMMPVGRLQFAIPNFQFTSYRLEQNIGPATVTGLFTKSAVGLAFRSWVAKRHNLLIIELKNVGQTQLPMNLQLRDAWNTPSQNQLTTGTNWSAIGVSPDSMRAFAGNRMCGGKPAAFDGRISAVQIFSSPVNPLRRAIMPAPAARYGWAFHGNGNIQPALAFIGTTPGKVTDSWTFTGSPRQNAALGVIRIPQRHFAVTAIIHSSARQKHAFIFTALANPYQPRGYPYHRGFALGVRNGRLFARLNRTVVTADSLLPLHHWEKIAAVYNGKTLTLWQNGVLLGATHNFPSTAEVMGANKGSIHTGDRKIPFDDCSPNGVMIQRVIGVPVTQRAGKLSFSIPAGGSAIVTLAVATDRSSPNYAAAARQWTKHITPLALTGMYRRHLAWWKAFWSRSFIEIPEKRIEAQWYGSLYDLACCSRPDSNPPGLWGNFITSRHIGWQGDYTLDYNHEATFWGTYPANHIRVADNYEKPMLENMPRAAAIARSQHYHGLYGYTHLIPTPGWDDDLSHFLAQKSAWLFGTVDCCMRWRYTRNVIYARRVYPYLMGVADFWDHYLVYQHGQYVDIHDAPDEDHDGNAINPATTLAFLRMLYPTLIEMSNALHRDAAQRPVWRHILRHLSPLPIVPATTIQKLVKAVGSQVLSGRYVIRQSAIGPAWINVGNRLQAKAPIEMEGSSAGMNSAQCIFPAWAIGLESSEADRAAALNTVALQKTWYDFNNTSSFYPAAACAGYNSESILHHIQLMISHFGMPNFAYLFGGGGVENFSTVPSTICAMFIQSYQHDIHLFPDWPSDKNARFGNLLACGNFLISSAIANGRVKYLTITSNIGRTLKLVNPWPGQKVSYTTDNGKRTTLTGKILVIATHPGEKIRFFP